MRCSGIMDFTVPAKFFLFPSAVGSYISSVESFVNFIFLPLIDVHSGPLEIKIYVVTVESLIKMC